MEGAWLLACLCNTTCRAARGNAGEGTETSRTPLWSSLAELSLATEIPSVCQKTGHFRVLTAAGLRPGNRAPGESSARVGPEECGQESGLRKRPRGPRLRKPRESLLSKGFLLWLFRMSFLRCSFKTCFSFVILFVGLLYFYSTLPKAPGFYSHPSLISILVFDLFLKGFTP